MNDKLGEYRRKRDFGATPEPSGRDGEHNHRRAARGGRRSRQAPLFVVQKHDASSLHYDFRLEVEGMLKSWAIPKGPSVDPRDKRLAVPTEDHPLDYADFEGVIPEGEYGAGTVLVWDIGRYEHRNVSASEALEKGRLNFWLEGDKLRGGYTLTRMGGRPQRGRQQGQQGQHGSQWLLIKMNDEGADRRRKPTKTQPRSALTGADLGDVAKHGEVLR